MDQLEVEEKCSEFIRNTLTGADAAHDPEHVKRVVSNVKLLSQEQEVNIAVLIPAAWLHDCVSVSKGSIDRKRASLLAADRAVEFLKTLNYDTSLLPHVHHAIAAHSFSAGIKAESLEAKILQDADRLDALGSIGIIRTLAVGFELDREIYHVTDPLAEARQADDSVYTIDHFFAKLFKLPALMNTERGRIEAERRVKVMQDFLQELKREVSY